MDVGLPNGRPAPSVFCVTRGTVSAASHIWRSTALRCDGPTLSNAFEICAPASRSIPRVIPQYVTVRVPSAFRS